MIIGQDLLGQLGIIMNFNDHKVAWNTDTIPMKDRGTLSFELSSAEALFDVNMSANKPQTLRDEYSCTTKILDDEYSHTPASLDDVNKSCENLHVEPIIFCWNIRTIQHGTN
jgi:hypothetical protein